jgi:hypothetical protein
MYWGLKAHSFKGLYFIADRELGKMVKYSITMGYL